MLVPRARFVPLPPLLQLPEERWEPIREQLLMVLNGSLRSSKPMIFGIPSLDAGGVWVWLWGCAHRAALAAAWGCG